MWRWTGRGTPTGRAVGQRRGRQAGFTLAAVVLIMAVMAIMLTVAVQTASFQKRRENEEELIFRGNQIVEAVRLFRARHGRFPVSLVELARVKPRVVRKVWTDPITGKPDWVPIFLGQEGIPLAGGPAGTVPTGGQGGLGAVPTPTGQAFPKTDASGPVIGAHSRSCETSIKVYNGRTRYCDWKFFFNPQTTPAGGGAGPGVPPPGGGPAGPRRPPLGGGDPPIRP